MFTLEKEIEGKKYSLEYNHFRDLVVIKSLEEYGQPVILTIDIDNEVQRAGNEKQIDMRYIHFENTNLYDVLRDYYEVNKKFRNAFRLGRKAEDKLSQSEALVVELKQEIRALNESLFSEKGV